MTINHFFVRHSKVAIAFSGGVDSAYLLYVAKENAREVKAYYVKTAFQPQFEYNDALRFAKEYEIEMETIYLDILADNAIVTNPQNRCYYCKKKIFTAIMNAAKKDGFTVLLDGTNASDEVDDRPGIKALQELAVLSPLRECELTKSKIRELSRNAGLFTWNKPAYACLATRIPTGQRIENRLLQRTEQAEGYLASIGFSDFRIRTVNEAAKIQINKEQLSLLMENRKKILHKLKEYYQSVLLDLEVRDEY